LLFSFSIIIALNEEAKKMEGKMRIVCFQTIVNTMKEHAWLQLLTGKANNEKEEEKVTSPAIVLHVLKLKMLIFFSWLCHTCMNQDTVLT
jgi:hypothetical protein